MTKTDQILQVCKREICQKYLYTDWHKLLNSANNQFLFIDELLELYAQRMSELFAEWIRENYFLNDNEKWCLYKYEGRTDPKEINYTTSELYTLFIEQLNK